MSDNWLQFIPVDPTFVPPESVRTAAIRLLETWLPEADEITGDVAEEIQLVDAGANLQSIHCPACRAPVDIDWWTEATDSASERGFADRMVAMPCCGGLVDLNELDYDWPQGFARFSLSAMNPNVQSLSPDQESRLAEVLGTPLRRIWTHI